MGKSYRNKKDHFYLYVLFVFLVLFLPLACLAKPPVQSVELLEEEAAKAVSMSVPCKKIDVKIGPPKEKSGAFTQLAVKLEGVVLGQMVADYMTLIYEDPAVDLIQLKKTNKLSLLSYTKNRVGILISSTAIEKYLKTKADLSQKKYNRISIKFAPPYIECLFDVPAREISAETMEVLDKFVKSGNLEGYAAFQIQAKNNHLYALSSKVIINHFLLPNMILQELQTKFNPFDLIPIIQPFQYSIDHVTIQNKYVYLSN